MCNIKDCPYTGTVRCPDDPLCLMHIANLRYSTQFENGDNDLSHYREEIKAFIVDVTRKAMKGTTMPTSEYLLKCGKIINLYGPTAFNRAMLALQQLMTQCGLSFEPCA